tara:strand:- start:1008 stop:1277 length:270 start_codon:yes stop_codon:yes gene_type:complete
MSIDKGKKTELIDKFSRSKSDTGSPEVQVAILTERIANLTEHFQSHKKDNHSRTGLMRMINQRRSLLTYIKRTNKESYDSLIDKLGIRK